MPASSRHLVDPELSLDALGDFLTMKLDETTLGPLRETVRTFILPVEHPERVQSEVRTVSGLSDDPDVALTIYRPAGATGTLPCIYYIHGGGYVTGDVPMMDSRCRKYVEALGCALVAVEYRLAPETPYPGPLDDCQAGLEWVLANAAEIGVDPARTGVVGESAGGGLAAALVLRVRDRVAFQHLVAPMLDDRTCVDPDPNPYSGEFLWTLNNNAFGWRSYLGKAPGGDDVSADAAPARATDLTGLPRTYIWTTALDLFVDEDIDYARRLIRAGVPTELQVFPGAFHGSSMIASAGITIRSERDSVEALRRALG